MQVEERRVGSQGRIPLRLETDSQFSREGAKLMSLFSM